MSIVSMQLSSHVLRCKMSRWGTSDESGLPCTLCSKQVKCFEYNSSIQCFTFDHIWLCFPHIFHLNPILAQISLTITMYTLNFTSISKALEHRESLLIFTLRGMEYFQSYKSYLTIEDYSKLYVSLSLSLCLGLFVGAFWFCIW